MSNKIRIKKALIEAKFMAKPEDMDKLMPKLEKDDIVKLVDEAEVTESDINEAPAKNNPKIEAYVNKLNELIRQAVDGDGDPIGVVDKSGTWEEPVVYQPIIYSNGALKIVSTKQTSNDPDTEIILSRNMEFDGIPTLKLLNRLYTNTIKKLSSSKPMGENDDERAGRSIEYGAPEPELGDADYEEIHKPIHEEGGIDTDKLRVDVAMLMDKLNLTQFDNVFKRIDKPQEQAEVIAAFAERIGVPRAKLGMVISTIKNVAENIKPSITKQKLEEFVRKQEKK